MRRRHTALVLVILCAVLGLSQSPAIANEATQAQDGAPNHVYYQHIPVNVVLVGYAPNEVGAAITDQLAPSGAPIVRAPAWYGQTGRNLGLSFKYDYRVIDAGKAFADSFFGYLTNAGTPGPLTLAQRDYNAQKRNVVAVKGPVLTVDAPATEKWLETNAASKLGIEDHSYTVFLVNWWGRSDFRFHVYRKTDAPDPDTGTVHGARDSRAMTAWGGTSGRSWFSDLSAGPEDWTLNWNVTDADLDGDDVTDYRMPPVWEYAANGFRSRKRLGADLGMIVRYVAVNLLFTSSPLYDPMVAAPGPGGNIAVPVTVFEDDKGASGASYIRPDWAVDKWSALEPYHGFQASATDVAPITPGPRRTLRIWTGLEPGDSAWLAPVRRPGCAAVLLLQSAHS